MSSSRRVGFAVARFLALLAIAAAAAAGVAGCEGARRLRHPPQRQPVAEVEDGEAGHAGSVLPPAFVYAFGDSITDTGNSPIANATLAGMVTQLPFGMTWFGHGSNRWSDGRLILDWLCLRAYASCAAAGGLLPPHLALHDGADDVANTAGTELLPGSVMSQNYAVAGATALSPEALKQAAGVDAVTPDSLDVQVRWFQRDAAAAAAAASSHPPGSYHGDAAAGGSSAASAGILIHLGEIGGDDVNYALRDGMSPRDIQERILPGVMAAVAQQLDRILSAAEELVAKEKKGRGTTTRVVIQGQFPMGCMPLYVIHAMEQQQQLIMSDAINSSSNTTAATSTTTPTASSSSASSELPDSVLDEWGCVAAVSGISDLQNELLRGRVIPAAEAKHPHVSFVFLDTSAAYRHILKHARAYGFSNLNDRMCDINRYIITGSLGDDDAAAAASGPLNEFCSDPSTFVSWDGIHLTDAMAGALVQLFLQPPPPPDQAEMNLQPFSYPFPNFLTALASQAA